MTPPQCPPVRPAPKERMKLPRRPMAERDPAWRAADFAEVNLGYDFADALGETLRCLQCADPKCVHGCPVGVKVLEMVELLHRGDVLGAAAKLREDNSLPAITGRVCPQEDQCEGACLLGKRGAPLAIGHLERFIADYERRVGKVGLPPLAPPSGRSVAIVGSGPAGLACAGDLVQKGHRVRVFEALHEIGGVLVYGIPEFRLPKEIVRQEVETLRAMGVETETNVVVGQTVTVDQLLSEEGYDAVFLATGAGLPRFLGIPGEHLNGVCSANELLTRVNLMKAWRFPDADQPLVDFRGRDAVVVGGGNTALDAVRTTLRLGARNARLLYRRSRAEMPGRDEEVHHAEQEGIEMRFLINPVEILGDADGNVAAVRCQRMELGEPDASGRRRPVPIAGSEHDVAASVVVVAVGTRANPIVQAATPDLATDRQGYIAVDPETLETSKRGVFAGGDIVTGAATVILAMGAGRTAAASIDRYLAGIGRG